MGDNIIDMMPSQFVLTTVKKGVRNFVSFVDEAGVHTTVDVHYAHKFARYIDASIYKNDNFMPGKARGWVAVRESDEMICGKSWFVVENPSTCQFVALVGSRWDNTKVLKDDIKDAEFFQDEDTAWSYCSGENIVVTLSEAIDHIKAAKKWLI